MSFLLNSFAGAAFSPLSISGLKLWLKADAGTLQTSGGSAASADGDPVGQWLDQSGQGNHVAQATGSQRPTLKLAIQNSLPIVRTDGVDDYLQNAANILGTGDQPFTLFLLLKTAVAVNSDKVAFEVGRVASGTFTRQYRFYPAGNSVCAGGLFFSNYANDRCTAAGLVTSGVFYSAAFSHAVGAVSATNPTFWVNGTQQASDPTNPFGTGTAAPNLDPGATTIGRDQESSPAEYWNGDFGEILLFDSALSASDLAAVHSYLRAKWGTP
jgi:hypothetical protein